MRGLFSALPLAVLLATVGCGSEPEKPVQRVNLAVEPGELAFGTVPVGTSAERVATLENLGPGEARIRVTELPRGYSVEPSSFRLVPGDTQELRIVLRPSAEGIAEGTIAFGSDRKGTAALAVWGEASAEAIELPGELDFGGVAVGESRSLPLEVKNLGASAVDVDLLLAAGEDFHLEAELLAIPSQGSASLEITFRPTRPGAFPGLLELQPCAGCRGHVVRLAGMGVVRNLAVEPSELDFGVVLPAGVGEREITVENRGNFPLALAPPVIEEGSTAFSIEAVDGEEPLAEGETRRFTVRFSPQGTGIFTARIAFKDEDGARLASIPLSGEGRAAEFDLDPPQLDFGTLLPLTTSWRSLRVRRLGESPTVAIVGASIPGTTPFSLRVPTFPWDPSKEAAFEVGFHPEAPGASEAELVLHLDGDVEPLRIPLRGAAVPAEPCSLVADVDELLFGLVPLDYEGEASFRLINESAQPCVFWDAQIVGVDAPLFEVEPEGLNEVPTGESLEVRVRVTTRENSSREMSASVRLRFGSPASPELLELPIVLGVNWALEELPPPYVFEETPVDRAIVRNAPGANLGVSPEIRFLEGSSSAFDVLDDGRIAFRPEQEGRHEGRLAVWAAGSKVPLLIDVEGEGGPPCAGCDWPEPFCAAPAARPFGEDLALADEGPHACNWSIVDPDEGVPVQDDLAFLLTRDDPTSCSATLHFFSPGEWKLGNLRIRQDGRATYCEEPVVALAPEGLWFEVRPDAGISDLDVVLLRDGDPALREDWFDPLLSCRAPHLPGDSCAWVPPDEPLFTWLQDFAYARVHAHLPAPEEDVPYHIGIYGEPQASMRLGVRIYCGGQLVSEESYGVLRGENRLRVHGTLSFSGSGTCTFLPDGATGHPYHLPPDP